MKDDRSYSVVIHTSIHQSHGGTQNMSGTVVIRKNNPDSVVITDTPVYKR